MTRFTLRSLFLIVTLAAAGLALVGNSLVEDRRQDRLVDEAIRAAEAEGSHLHSFGYEDGAVESGVFGDRLSEATVRRLIRAKRIQWVEIIDDRGASPMAQILAQEFIPDESDGVLGKWRRKGGERTPTKRLAWSRVNYRVIQGPNLWPGPLKK